MIKHLININGCRLKATHSSILAWEIPWTEEPDGLLFMESQRVGHDWATNTHTHRKQNQDIVGRPTMGSCCSVTKSCLTLSDPMDCSTPAACVVLCLLEFAQSHLHWCYLNILSSAALLSFRLLSQHQCLFQWVSSLHQVAKVLEIQLRHQSVQWIFRVDFLLDWLVWPPCSPRDSQASSPAP